MTDLTSIGFYLLKSLGWTIALSLIGLIGGSLLGFLIALLRISRHLLTRLAAVGYIELFQGLPLLMVLFLFYYGLPVLGYSVSPILASGLAIAFYSAAFFGDIWRSAFQSVSPQQWEAASALGLSSTQRFFHVIFPQSLRIAVPPTVGFIVQLVKNTSIASLVGVIELTRAGQLLNNTYFMPFTIFILIAALYFIICYPVSKYSQKLEKRIHVDR